MSCGLTGAIPEIDDFDEEELMNARLLVEQEAEEQVSFALVFVPYIARVFF